jgi:hypothetical protein
VQGHLRQFSHYDGNRKMNCFINFCTLPVSHNYCKARKGKKSRKFNAYAIYVNISSKFVPINQLLYTINQLPLTLFIILSAVPAEIINRLSCKNLADGIYTLGHFGLWSYCPQICR